MKVGACLCAYMQLMKFPTLKVLIARYVYLLFVGVGLFKFKVKRVCFLWR